MFDRIVARYRERLGEYLARWAPEEQDEVRAMLRRLADELLSEFPAERDRHDRRS
jgi:hypothetical protein